MLLWTALACLSYLGTPHVPCLWHAMLYAAQPAILVDTGSADKFLTEQLKPESLEAAAKESGYGNVTVRTQVSCRGWAVVPLQSHLPSTNGPAWGAG